MEFLNMPFAYSVTPQMLGYAMAYKIQGLVADKMFPMIDNMDGKDAFKLLLRSPGETMRVVDDKVGRRSDPNEVEYNGKEATDSCDAHFLTGFVAESDMQNSDQGRYENLVNREQGTIWETILLNREVRCIKLAQDIANYKHKLALTATTSLANADADIVAMLLDYLTKPLMRPNQLRMGDGVWAKLRTHPSVVNSVYPKSDGKGYVRREDLASVLEIDEVVVGSTKVNSAAKGQTDNIVTPWGETISAAYVNPQATKTEGLISHGFTAVNGGRIVRLIPNEKKGGRGGVEVLVGQMMKEAVPAPDCGFILTDVLKAA